MTRAKTAGMRLLFTLVTAGALAAVLSTSPNSAAADKLRVGVNVTTIETVPIYLAAEGPLRDAITLTGGAIPLLTEGKVDTVTNAETQALLRSTANPDIRVILTVAEYSYRIVARRSSGIATASDLRGKKIATQLNSSAHFYIVKTLRGAGLSEADVTVVGMTPPEMPAALARHDVDAVSIWEPAAEKSVAALGADAVILSGPAYRERFNLNTTTGVLSDPAKRKAIVDLLRVLIDTSRDAHEHPERAKPLIAAKLGLTEQFVSTVWGLFSFPASIPDDLLASMVEQEPWIAQKQNRPARSPQAIAALIDASLLRDAKAAARP
jgi:ABC-type nitrate/sulfonate/bicarbonate transport system substrate-binding protein